MNRVLAEPTEENRLKLNMLGSLEKDTLIAFLRGDSRDASLGIINRCIEILTNAAKRILYYFLLCFARLGSFYKT